MFCAKLKFKFGIIVWRHMAYSMLNDIIDNQRN